MKMKRAVQLFTMRNECAEDFPGVLRKIKEMGWDGVQIDGLFGYSAEEIAGVLNETKLEAAGMHIGADRMTEDLDNVMKESYLFGTKDIFCHFVEEEFQNPAGYFEVKQILMDLAKKLQGLGFRIGYHHHDFEFHTKMNGGNALEYMLKKENNMFLYPEFDTYWLKKGGVDPLEFIQRYSDRIPYLHFKDMTNDERETFAEVGTGLIDFQSIINYASKKDVEWLLVEQDECEKDPFESIAISKRNLDDFLNKVGN